MCGDGFPNLSPEPKFRLSRKKWWWGFAYQRKHQNSASLAFVRGFHRWPMTSPHKGPVTRKMFPFDGAIMTHLLSDLFVVPAQIVNWYVNTHFRWTTSLHLRIWMIDATHIDMLMHRSWKWSASDITDLWIFNTGPGNRLHRQTPSQCRNKYWPSSMALCGVTKSEWIKS